MTSRAWNRLRGAVAAQAHSLRPPLAAGPGVCPVCRGPARAGYLHCFHCAVHAERAAGLVADAVVPTCYAIKGEKHARDLWLYKSRENGAADARAALLSLLLVFLRDHGGCAWRLAGGGAPTHLAVVPSTRGRRGSHPLQTLTAPVLGLPWQQLELAPWPDQPDPDDRDLALDRFTARGRLSGAQVLLLDDTWTTGSRVQSAAAALKLAGAARVVAVVLGRHLNMQEEEGMDAFAKRLGDRRYVVRADGLWPCPAPCPRKP